MVQFNKFVTCAQRGGNNQILAPVGFVIIGLCIDAIYFILEGKGLKCFFKKKNRVQIRLNVIQ